MGRSRAVGSRFGALAAAIHGAGTATIPCHDGPFRGTSVKHDQKNFVIFAALAALILFGWPQIAHWIFPQQQPASVKIEGGKTKAVPNPGADPAGDSPKALRDRQIVLAETPRVQI